MSENNKERSLEIAYEVAGARLAMAESLGFYFAIAVGVCVYMVLNSWLLSVAVFAVTYFGMYSLYDKEYERASKEWHARLFSAEKED